MEVGDHNLRQYLLLLRYYFHHLGLESLCRIYYIYWKLIVSHWIVIRLDSSYNYPQILSVIK